MPLHYFGDLNRDPNLENYSHRAGFYKGIVSKLKIYVNSEALCGSPSPCAVRARCSGASFNTLNPKPPGRLAWPESTWEFPKSRGTLFGVLIMRILQFRELKQGPLFSETPKSQPKPYSTLALAAKLGQTFAS